MNDRTSDELRRQAGVARELLIALADYDEETRHDMTEGETDLFQAVDRAIDEIDDCAAVSAGCGSVIETYKARKQKAEARADRVRGLIEQAMLIADIPTIKLPRATITVKRVPPKPMVTDESLIPVAFWKPQPPTLDRTAIADAMKNSGSVEGVVLDNGGTSLQIRRL